VKRQPLGCKSRNQTGLSKVTEHHALVVKVRLEFGAGKHATLPLRVQKSATNREIDSDADGPVPSIQAAMGFDCLAEEFVHLETFLTANSR
jgi:hypothetical protein